MMIQLSRWTSFSLGLWLLTATVVQAAMKDIECYDSASGQDMILHVRDNGGVTSLFSVRYQGFDRLASRMVSPTPDREMYQLVGVTGALLVMSPAVLSGSRGEIEFLAAGANATYTCN